MPDLPEAGETHWDVPLNAYLESLLSREVTLSADPGEPQGVWNINYSTNSSTSPDTFQTFLSGLKTFWLNENGNPRATSAKSGEAALKLFAHSAQAAHIFQLYLAGESPAGTPSVYVDANGNLRCPNFQDRTWTALTGSSGTYVAEDPTSGTGYQPGCRLEGAAGELVRLRGRFAVTNTTSGDSITTLPAGHRPARVVNFQLGNNAGTAITASIGTGGVITCNRSVTSAGFVSLDGFTFSRTA